MAATVPSSSRLREVHYSEEVVAAAAELRIEPRRGIATVVDPELADMIGKAFARADSGGKGWLTREDLEVASVAVLGFTLSVDVCPMPPPQPCSPPRLLSGASGTSVGTANCVVFASVRRCSKMTSTKNTMTQATLEPVTPVGLVSRGRPR
eukprot:m.345021 g.345021  ORF g.345021 m.345021 type:complete len:151 (-) comp16552_c0_seq30:2904-3356(-)